MSTCPIPGCSFQHGSHLLMCRAHWSMVPQPLQEAVGRAYSETRTNRSHAASIAHAEAACSAIYAVAAMYRREMPADHFWRTRLEQLRALAERSKAAAVARGRA